ncbi:LL-diaminopimelate aminotransferase [Limibaculum sp. FT325]|uniref:LL-diaminopimelate aminotransferase n=1 Tax=Thermohalobaculum sediminis TaxID=2939436 RepID=UPI0020BFA6BE|nr:LL-diaminopimelate aminotransferase [Limibaculum sediminis]MCL5778521.1 LL-diaminopimelate aminotransferase [Limibaculum sediminis]
MAEEFYRIKRLPPYVFAEVNRMKAEMRAAGRDIIDFGMGNPDMDTPAHIVEKLVETVKKPRTHRYSASKGIPGLRRAQAGYYARRFGVTLDPERQVIATLGSKEGLANLAMAITAPGDVILSPNPSYPIHPYGFMIAGGTLRHIPALDDGRFNPEAYLRALDRAIHHSVPKPVALIVSFPSNPTAQVCDLDFYRDLVALARKYGVWILSDLAYAEIYFDGNPPPSVLQIPGAMECTVEFTSLSKTYSMPGWRMGFAVGNERLIAALTRIKSYLDYGAFTPVQVAAASALNGPQDCVEEIRGIYRARRDVLIDAMKRAGWDIPPPPATMFAWAPIPAPFAALGSMEFAKILLAEAEVAVAPGVGFGEYGEGFVRLGLVENEHRIRQAARGVKRVLQNADEILARYGQFRENPA